MSLTKRTMVVAAAALLLGGCKDMGLQELQERQVAVNQEPFPVVALTTPNHTRPPLGLPSPVVQVGGQSFVASGEEVHLPAGIMSPVGNAGPVALGALKWDRPPYDALLAKTRQGYIQLTPVY